MTEVTFVSALQRATLVVCDLVQGDVLAIPDACVTLADATAPLSAEAAAIAADGDIVSGILVVPQRGVDDVVLLTQTCDLQVTDEYDFLCLVAPVVEVTQGVAREALRGRRPRLAALPWLGETTVVDFSRITTIERSLLVGATRRGRPRHPLEALSFAESIGRYLTRPALPDHVNDVLKPLTDRMLQQVDKDSAEGRCFRALDEIRVEGSPHLEAADVALNVLLVLESEKLPTLRPGVEVNDDRVDALVASGRGAAAEAIEHAATDVARREAWIALAECWVEPASARVQQVDGVGDLRVEVLNDAELSYARSRNAPVLDYRFLSTRAA